MASNTWGRLFKITTWGEAHGKAIGVVIDGCPAGLALELSDIQHALDQRRPGKTAWTSPRQETDHAEIYSGVFEGRTTGAPISIIIPNIDVRSKPYEATQHLRRPGHANYTYLEKYGIFDHFGGGRASARETACRVAAGAVAKKLLETWNIEVLAYLEQVGSVVLEQKKRRDDIAILRAKTQRSAIFCPDEDVEKDMIFQIESAQNAGDSVGGVVAFYSSKLPVGLGDPVYEKLEANLAQALLSIPASKGFEIGEGFSAARFSGQHHNDLFVENPEQVMASNHAGGTLAGISTGLPLIGRVAFKPTSSIKKPQATVDHAGRSAVFQLPEGSRHDPCIAIRAVPVIEAMCALVLVDAMLMNRCAKVLI